MTIQPYQIFNQIPNWESGISVKYSYLTSLISSQRYKEQRKAMRDIPLRSISFDMLLDSSSMEIFNYIIACLQKIMYVPLFNERVLCKSTGDNLSVIDTEDTENFYNLRRLSPENVIVNTPGSIYGETQIQTVSGTIDDGTIPVDPISMSYISDVTTIYPALPATLSSIKKTSESAKLDTYNLTFDEFVEETL